VTEPDPIYCLVCRRPGRIPDRPPVCTGDRTGIHGWLAEIPDLYAHALTLGYVLRDVRGVRVDDQGQHKHYDPVANTLPSGPLRRTGNSPRVSGSPTPVVPADLTVVDLTLPARQGSRGPYVRGILGLDPDQHGVLSVATDLETICREWIRESWCRVDHMPQPDVTSLCEWLRTHLDDACDYHEGIKDAADVIRSLRYMLLEDRANRSGEPIGDCPARLRDGSYCATTLRCDPYLSRVVCRRCGTCWDRQTGGWRELRAAQWEVEQLQAEQQAS
jgi:hypothetical protein